MGLIAVLCEPRASNHAILHERDSESFPSSSIGWHPFPRSDVALDPIHYAQFSTLTTIITAHDACWRALDYSSDHTASSHLHDIVELRNDVAHSTPLIQNTSRGLTETGRTITDLQEHHHHIQTLLNN